MKKNIVGKFCASKGNFMIFLKKNVNNARYKIVQSVNQIENIVICVI